MSTLFKALASAGFLGLAAVEVHHDLIVRAPWPGHALAANYVVFLYVPLWVLGAVSVWIPRPTAWFGILPGILVCLPHMVGTSYEGTLWGVLFFAAAPTLLVLALLGRRPSPALELGRPAEPPAVRRPEEARPREPVAAGPRRR